MSRGNDGVVTFEQHAGMMQVCVFCVKCMDSTGLQFNVLQNMTQSKYIILTLQCNNTKCNLEKSRKPSEHRL